MAADSDNLRIQQQINAAIAERGKLLSSQTSIISDQVELAVSFCKAMKCEDIDKISDRITEIRAGLESAGRAAQDSSGKIDSLSAGLGDASERADRLSSSTMDVKGAMDSAKKSAGSFASTLGSGLSSARDVMDGIGSAALSVGESIFNIGAAVLAIPLKVFDMMLGKAAELANASQEISRAQEDVRKQFGDIQKGFAKEVVAGGASIAKGLAEAGTSVSAVFGMGPEGTAASIRASLEMATALGAAVNLLGKDFREAAGRLFVFQRGLGLSDEDMKSFVYASKSMGTDVVKDLEKVAKIADDMGDKFGMASKDIARDLAYMTTQSAKFGKLNTEQMAAASVTVRSYGLELKDVVGIMDQFSDFESAATNASKLAQAFGATIDPMKMMKEENPAKQFEYLRKQMLGAGQDASTMNKAQLKLLATQTGMDENMVRVAFSAKNVGKSYEQIQKEAEKSGKKQKSQQEIYEQLGRSIDKMTESLQHSGSFMEEFFAGFAEGVSRASPFKGVVIELAKALRAVRMVGREVGDAFVKAFPGVRDMLGAMKDFFGGGGFTKLVKGFGESIKEFFTDLNGDPAKAFEKFYDNIKKKFFDLLDSNSGPGKKFMEGAKKFIMALSGILSGAIKSLGEALAKGLKQLAEFIKNPEEAMKAAGQSGQSFFAPIMKSLMEVLPQIGDALLDVLTALFYKIGPKLAIVIGAVFALSIGKAFLMGAAASVGGALVSAGAGLLQAGLSKLVASKIAPTEAGTKKATKGSSGFGSVVGNFFTELAVGLGEAKAGLSLALENMPKVSDVVIFSLKMTLIALALSPLFITLTLLLPFIAGAALSSAALVVIFESIAKISKALEDTKKVNFGKAAGVLFTMGIFIVALTALVLAVVYGFVKAMLELPIKTLADAGSVLVGLLVLGAIVGGVAALGLVAAEFAKVPVSQAAMGLLALGLMLYAILLIVPLATQFVENTKGLIKSPAEAGSVAMSLLALTVIVAATALLAIAAAQAGTIIAAAGPMALLGILAVLAMIPVVMLLAMVAADFVVATKGLIKSPAEAMSVMVSLVALGVIVAAIAVLTMVAAAAGVVLVATGPLALVGFIAIAAVAVGIMAMLPIIASFLSSPEVKKIEPAKALAFATVFALVFAAVGATVIAAAAIGAMVVGSLGVGGIAIAVGLGVIADAMKVIKDYVPPIVGALLEAGSSLTGEDVQKRAEAVGKILAGIGGLFSPIQAAVALSESSEGAFSSADLKGVQAVFETVKTFIVDIMVTAQTVVEALIKATSGLSENDLKGVEAGGKVLGAVGQIVGSLTSVLTKIDFSANPASIAAAGAVMKQAIPALDSMLSNIGTQMKTVIDQVRLALSGIGEADLKMLGPRLEMVAKIFGVIGDFSGLMKDNEITPEQAVVLKAAEASGTVLNGFAGVMEAFIKFINDPKGGLKKIAAALGTFPEFDAKKLDSVINLMKSSIEVATAFSLMTKSFEKNYVSVEGLDYSQRALTHATNFAKQAVEELKGVELLPGKKIENIKGGLVYIEEMISNYAEVVNSLSKVDAVEISKLSIMFANIHTAKYLIDSMGDVNTTKKSAEALSEITNVIPNMVDNLKTLSGFSDINANALFQFMNDFLYYSNSFEKNGGYTFFDQTLNRLGDMATAMSTFRNAYGVGLASFLNEAVADMRALNNILNKLEIDPIDVTIDKLADKLLIKRQDIQIQSKPININLTMNVSFKAEEFVKDIFKVAGSLTKKSNGTLDSFATELNKIPAAGGR